MKSDITNAQEVDNTIARRTVTKIPYSEIFQKILDEYQTTAYAMSVKLGINPNSGGIRNIVNGKNKPSLETINSILLAYPDLNKNFVTFGEYPIRIDINAKDLGSPLDIDYVEIPFVSVKAQAGFIGAYNNDYEKLETEMIRVPKAAVKNAKTTKCFEIEGSSMEPQLKNGAKVIGELVAKGDWIYLNSGIYTVLFDSKLTIKRIKSNNIRIGELELHSDNPLHGSLTIDAKELREIWKITRIVDSPIE